MFASEAIVFVCIAVSFLFGCTCEYLIYENKVFRDGGQNICLVCQNRFQLRKLPPRLSGLGCWFEIGNKLLLLKG